MKNSRVVQLMRAAFQDQNRAAAEDLLADGFVFTSPQDDRIDKATYLEVCFPTSGHFTEQVLMELLDVGEHTVISRYEYGITDGTRYRNVEAATVVDGRITEVEVYFGGEVPAGR